MWPSHSSKHWIAAAAASAALVVAPMAALAQSKVEIKTPGESKVETIPAYNPHRVVVYDQNFPHLEATSAWFIDGDSGKIEGMIGTSYQSNLAFSSKHDKFYVTDTYYSRLTRGDRLDVVTFYDTKTLEPEGEVELPKGRYLVVQKKYNMGMTTDGHYALSMNSTPAMSVSVVDVENKKYLGEIQGRGCWGIFPTGDSRYVSICSDGSLLTVNFKATDDGGVDASFSKSDSFFKPMEGTVFEAPGFGRRENKLMFVSYQGLVHPVDVSKDKPKFGDTWPILGDEDKGWLPGGWQPLAYSSQTKRLYVLMHEGGKWTHKWEGTQVWVFDAKTHKRVQRIKLGNETQAISISPDDEQLYALAGHGELEIFDAHSGELKHTVTGLGITPATMYSAKDMQ